MTASVRRDERPRRYGRTACAPQSRLAARCAAGRGFQPGLCALAGGTQAGKATVTGEMLTAAGVSAVTLDAMPDADINLWGTSTHALGYLARADSIPRRGEGERALLEFLPVSTIRLLDLGTGDGRLLALVRHACPQAEAVALDFSETMLEQSRRRFTGDPLVTVVAHDMNVPLNQSLGTFDAVVSSFAIHHLPHDRKRSLYEEVYRLLRPGGAFLNLEHVASPTEALHLQFLAALGVAPGDEDPSNKLLDVETQLAWLRTIGFIDVDCHWKWRELALLAGSRPAAGAKGAG
jgi:SAM-dependent methyltransferase